MPECDQKNAFDTGVVLSLDGSLSVVNGLSHTGRTAELVSFRDALELSPPEPD